MFKGTPAGIIVTAGYWVLGPDRMFTLDVAKPPAACATTGDRIAAHRDNAHKSLFVINFTPHSSSSQPQAAESV
jgi:hypothetical protein